MKTHDNVTVHSSRGAEALLHDNLSTLDHEEVWIIYLRTNCSLIGSEMISRGTLDQTSVDCRTVLRQSLLNNAGGIILLHNHPSGDSQPSQADIRFTDRLRQACSLMGINLVDHIIVAEESFFSFCEEKTFKYIK